MQNKMASTSAQRCPHSRDSVFQLFSSVQDAIHKEKERLASVRVKEDCALAAEVASISGQQVPGAATLEELLRRPHVHYRCAMPLC